MGSKGRTQLPSLPRPNRGCRAPPGPVTPSRGSLTVLEVGGAEGLVSDTISWMASRSLSRCRALLMPISRWISVSDSADMMAPLLTLARQAATYQAGMPTQSCGHGHRASQPLLRSWAVPRAGPGPATALGEQTPTFSPTYSENSEAWEGKGFPQLPGGLQEERPQFGSLVALIQRGHCCELLHVGGGAGARSHPHLAGERHAG